jgi:hypothetical protein
VARAEPLESQRWVGVGRQEMRGAGVEDGGTTTGEGLRGVDGTGQQSDDRDLLEYG